MIETPKCLALLVAALFFGSSLIDGAPVSPTKRVASTKDIHYVDLTSESSSEASPVRKPRSHTLDLKGYSFSDAKRKLDEEMGVSPSKKVVLDSYKKAKFLLDEQMRTSTSKTKSLKALMEAKYQPKWSEIAPNKANLGFVQKSGVVNILDSRHQTGLQANVKYPTELQAGSTSHPHSSSTSDRGNQDSKREEEALQGLLKLQGVQKGTHGGPQQQKEREASPAQSLLLKGPLEHSSPPSSAESSSHSKIQTDNTPEKDGEEDDKIRSILPAFKAHVKATMITKKAHIDIIQKTKQNARHIPLDELIEDLDEENYRHRLHLVQIGEKIAKLTEGQVSKNHARIQSEYQKHRDKVNKRRAALEKSNSTAMKDLVDPLQTSLQKHLHQTHVSREHHDSLLHYYSGKKPDVAYVERKDAKDLHAYQDRIHQMELSHLLQTTKELDQDNVEFSQEYRAKAVQASSKHSPPSG